jgi:G3E family GTPase
MLGGFLGAGKTTAIARLARTYADRGKQVAIVTNDHASELVDTHTLRSLGFNVGEIPGACFCGNLDELISAVERASAFRAPDVVFVEPVGSCTDMVATVIRPFKRLLANQFEVAPYGVLLKPSHGKKILGGELNGGFSPQAEYIFRQQLEEADFVVINRIDQLSSEQADELEGLLRAHYPDMPALRTSAKTGQGFEALVEFLERPGEFGNRVLALDYERYAEGEAELGWLNSSFLVQSQEPFELDQLLLGIVNRLHHGFLAATVEAAHVKLIGQWEGAFAVANLVASKESPELSLASQRRVSSAHLTVNARVAAAPTVLETHVSETLQTMADAMRLQILDRYTQSFRPGRPIPQRGNLSAVTCPS